MVQGGGDLGQDPDRGPGVERAGRGEMVRQGGALDQLEDDERALLVVTGVEHGDDPGMVETCGGLRLTLETRRGDGVVGEMGQQALDRNQTTQERVPGPPHGGHATGPDLLDRLIAITDHRVRLRRPLG